MTKAFLAVETLTLYRWSCPFEQLARVMVAYNVNVLPTLVAEFLGLFAYALLNDDWKYFGQLHSPMKLLFVSIAAYSSRNLHWPLCVKVSSLKYKSPLPTALKYTIHRAAHLWIAWVHSRI